MSEWKPVYLCAPETTAPEERLLRKLAKEYHERTEAYDRSVCTGPIVHGGILPATDEQFVRISSHAKAVREELGAKAGKMGFTTKQWSDAIRIAAQYRR